MLSFTTVIKFSWKLVFRICWYTLIRTIFTLFQTKRTTVLNCWLAGWRVGFSYRVIWMLRFSLRHLDFPLMCNRGKNYHNRNAAFLGVWETIICYYYNLVIYFFIFCTVGRFYYYAPPPTEGQWNQTFCIKIYFENFNRSFATRLLQLHLIW